MSSVCGHCTERKERPIKAITVHQPWASLIVLGIKTIETRSWRLPDSMVGQRIAIHAGAHKLTRREIDELNERWTDADAPVAIDDGALWWRGDPVTTGHTNWKANLIHRVTLPLGAIVGYATLGEDLPIVCNTCDPHPGEPSILYYHGQGPTNAELYIDPHGDGRPEAVYLRDISDQLPYAPWHDLAHSGKGHGWPLTDPEPCDPIPAKGRLGFWDWEAAA